MSGVMGNVMSCLLLVVASNIVIATNIAPVFMEPRTNRLVYPTRYIQWMLTAPEMIIFSFRFLFNKPAMSWRCVGSCCSIGPCIVFGLWGAIASSWGLFWFFGLMAWSTYFLACYFFWREFKVSITDDPLARYGSVRAKKFVMAVSFVLWTSLGVWWIIAFTTGGYLSLDDEFKGYAIVDVLLKTAMIVMNMAWDESRWAVRNAVLSYTMVSRNIDSEAGNINVTTEAAPNPLRPQPAVAAVSTPGEQTLPTFDDATGIGATRRVDLLFQMIPRTQEQREGGSETEDVGKTRETTTSASKAVDKSLF